MKVFYKGSPKPEVNIPCCHEKMSTPCFQGFKFYFYE